MKIAIVVVEVALTEIVYRNINVALNRVQMVDSEGLPPVRA